MNEENTYKISMPHKHTVTYEEKGLEISFETELAIDGIIFYTKSGKILKGKTDDIEIILNRVISWLKKDRDKNLVHEDNS